MDGTAPARELKPRFEVATPADDEGIRRLLRDNPMRGSVTVSFEREPDYFSGADIAGGRDLTIVVNEGERVVCMGRCIRRECWLNGRPHDVGYLAELRLDASARGRFGIIRDGFRFFHEKQRDNPAAFYFTSIAADNERARRLLESGARGLPQYSFLGELDTLLIAVPRILPKIAPRIERMKDEHIEEVLILLSKHGRKFSLATRWTKARLQSLVSDALVDIFVMKEGGDIVACGGLWDQRGFRQTVIRGYSRALKIARPIINWAGRLFGGAQLPAVGATLPQVFLTPFVAGPSLSGFIAGLFPFAAGAGFITLALPRRHDAIACIRRSFTTRTWRSRLYRVSWPGEDALEINGAVLPDVALL